MRKEIEESFRSALEAFIAWQTENPIVPTEEQDEDLCEWCEMNPDGSPFAEWQRRMYLAPEPEVQEEIRDLLLVNITEGFFKPEVLNERLAEAYRRGQKSVHA